MEETSPHATRTVRARGLPLLRDIVILVVGILAAFSLDSWWDNRTRASQRAEDVAALTADFTSNRNQLDELVGHQERVAATSRRLAQADDALQVPSDSARALLSSIFSSRRFEPLLSSYVGIVETGGLNRPEDRELRAALAGFAAAIEVRHSEDFADALYLDLINDFPNAIRFVFEGSTMSFSPNAIVADPSFRTALNLRSTAEAEVGRRYSFLLERVDHILSLLGHVHAAL